MRHIGAHHMIGLVDELQKEGGVAGDFLRRHLAGKYLRQVGVGAGLGALGGAALGGEGGRVQGALRGGLVGAGVGGAGVLAQKGGREAIKGGLGRFYKRQMYGLTGKIPGQKGVAPTVEEARKIKLIPEKTTLPAGPLKPGQARETLVHQGNKALKSQLAREATEEEAFRRGWMSMPGVISALGTKGERMPMIRSAWDRAGGLGKVFAGLGAYEAGKGFIKTPEPGGPGRLESGLRGAGSAAGWLIAPQTLVAGQLVGEGAGRLAGGIGKGLSSLVPSRGAAAPAQQGRWVPGARIPTWEGQ